MSNDGRHTDRKELARNAAAGYTAVVLGTICFILALAAISTIVRLVATAGAGA